MQLLQPISTIAYGFEIKIKELNDTFRLFHEKMFNKVMESENEVYYIPNNVKSNVQNHIQDLQLYIVNNYNKLPINKRIEIKYYCPLNGTCEEILVSTAIRYVFAFYLQQDLITDSKIVNFGNSVIDNYLIVINEN